MMLFLFVVAFATLQILEVAAVAASETATPLHQVSVSISSARSILYHGMQVPVFQNTGSIGSGRYFFPPLALLDCSSMRIINSGDTSADDSSEKVAVGTSLPVVALLRLSVLLWTDEFLTAARAQLGGDARADETSIHVELMPLTELTLNWSTQADRWLGNGFKQRFRLVYAWQDAQRPLARANFAVSCASRSDCEQLLAQLGDTDSAGLIFDLKYRIRCDSQRRISATLASRHLLRSPLFTHLYRFGAKSSGIVLASEATVDQLAVEMRRASLDDLQEQQAGEQRADSVDPVALSALLADAGSLLRRVPVKGAGLTQWAERVFWQPSPNSRGLASSAASAALRPDRLASLFNRLFSTEVGGPPKLVRPTSASSSLVASLESEGDLPSGAGALIRQFLATHNRPGAEPIRVEDVSELASSLGSAVAWNASSIRFVPSPNVQLYQLDTGRLLSLGTFAVRDVLLHYRVSEQRDHVVPLCRAVHSSADYTTATWTAQAEMMRKRYEQLLRRANNASNELQRIASALTSARAESGPHTSVRHRSAEDSSAPYPAADEDGTSLDALRLQLQTLSGAVNGSVNDAEEAWQRQFAGSFCILANSGPPPRGMTCRTISFVIPKSSLRKGKIFNRQVRVGTGTAGQNLIEPHGKRFFRVQLRGCCK